jgi:hypothetical protein
MRSSVGISATSSYEMYLGLPSLVGCSKTKTFAELKVGYTRILMGERKSSFPKQENPNQGGGSSYSHI